MVVRDGGGELDKSWTDLLRPGRSASDKYVDSAYPGKPALMNNTVRDVTLFQGGDGMAGRESGTVSPPIGPPKDYKINKSNYFSYF